ncbi:uncharacterized protein LOC130419221 isoform X2 [Triplophysa dalaica]|uniref:uncharacterized protein LOC130419221 isoform X2 n=1 Tax=Triplophysa dalaica TaxID=1582913 RepID=UPI0024DF5DF6|nr:uncharacterized protein LOC130419221 isoform X2 [Triplophysa dalaica]
MDAVGVNVIETATLGRPFQLGTLYDCRKDALVPGITLWGKEQLHQSIRSHAQINTDFNVTASDSIEEKSNLLNIDGSLKLSLLSGLVNVRGAAKYLSDTKKSFKQQRLTLHYHSTTKFEELTMNHLGSGKIVHYEAFDNDAATHVVTAVLYGANACFVFDREVSSDEDKTTIEGEVKATFDKLKGISLGAEIDLNMNDNQKNAVQKFSCTFYGDFQLPSNPTSFEDALKIFADLPKLLGEKKELAVPLRVWLYPLDKLHTSAAKVQKDISTGLIKAVESVFESLSTTEMKCADLLKEPPALAFAAFNGQIMQMRENCCSYKFSLMKKLGSLLPEIRGDQKKETELNDLLRDHMESPFRGQNLEHWVKEKAKESAVIKTLIRQLNDYGAKVEVNLDEILMDLEVEHLVSYTFTSFEGPDVLLSTQKDYLSPKGQKKENAPSAKWMTGLSSDAKKNMRTNTTLFKNLIKSKQRKPAKFIVASKEVKNIEGSCILLYENGSDEDICFTPPLKPACPVIEQIKGHSVVLQVPTTCQATEDLRLMYKIKEDKDWKSQHVQQSKETLTLTDLSPDTEYEIKYTAVGKLNYTVDSDVIHITVIDKKLISATESVLESLTLTEKKCSELVDDSRSKIFGAFNRKIQDMMKHCQTYRQDLSTRIQSLIHSIQACEKGICDLEYLLQAHEESPFKATSLREWITIKEKELNVVSTIFHQLLDSGAEEHINLDEILSDINVENVVCYTFSSLEEPDEFLSDHENYLKHQMIRRDLEKMPDAVSRTWLQGTVTEKIREHLKLFKDIMTSHGSQSTKFLVSSKDHTIHLGSCILFYENGSHEALCFAPPSKPACPIIIQVKGYSVVLKIPPTCQATEDLRLMYKIKEDKDWKSQHVQQSKETLTLTDLNPEAEYEIKYTAVGKLNYTVDSDVIYITVIDKKLISATESVLESLTLTGKKCSELMDDSRSKIFGAFNRKIQDMMKHCQTYRQDLSTRIQSLIHSIQACENGICDLEYLLQAHEESPFKATSLREWITIKEKELYVVSTILQQLLDSGAVEHNNLDEILSDINVENVLCYTFSSLEEPDELLSDHENYLKHQMIRRDLEKMPDAVSRTWLQGTVTEKMREHLKLFKDIMTSHGSQSTKFLVSSKDHTIHPGSCILFYENGSHEALCFTPPSKPACPIIIQVKGHSVVLNVPPTFQDTEDLRLMYNIKEDKDWKSQHVQQSKETLTLTDLSPDTEYEIKFTAVGKLNYTVDSDVIYIKVIDKKLISATESILESLTLTEKKCYELVDDSRSKVFGAFNRKIQDMMKHCQTYRQDLSTRIQSLIHLIQVCENGICDLEDLLQAHEESPFKATSLIEWITIKEKELNVVSTILQQLLDSGAEEHNNLDEILSDINVENVLCYTFSSLEEPDEFLYDHENYLKHQMIRRDLEKMPDAVSRTWLQGTVTEKMREHLKLFKDIMTSHGSQSTKFLVSSKDHTIHPGSCILFYENGSHETLCFTPPSKPACPIIIQVKGHSVVLNVPPTCQATEDLRLMYKIKEDKDWKSQHVQQSKETLTLTDLNPETQYEIKYTAVGKLNYTVDSDVIYIKVIDKKLISATESVLESLTLTEKKCSELMDSSRTKIFGAFNRKIQDMMKRCQTYRQDLSTRIQSLIHSIQVCENGICDLEDLLQAHEESPFKATSLIEWITIKEKELNVVSTILQQLLDSGAEEHNNLDEILSDINVENVLCYTFSSLEEPDEFLSDHENYLKHQMIRRDLEKMPDAVSRTWLQGTVRDKMREHLKKFKDIMTSHGSQSTKFLVSSKDHTIHPGSCILLYENGSHEALCFTPPSKPACPIIKQVRGHSVVFEMPSPCPETVELKLLYKMKEEREWKSQHVHKSQDTVTLEDLSPDTQYDVKYTAVGKLNYTTDSDVIRVEEGGTRTTRDNGGVKLFSDLAGKTNGGHKSFFDTLENRIKDLREVPTMDDSDIFLVYCPLVSRHGNDIEAALKRFTDSTASKLKVLVVLHHTFDPEKTVPDSSRRVNRTDILTVDCLFYEDTGLLKCQKNDDAIDKVVNLLRQQRKEKYVNEFQSRGPLHKNVAPNDNLRKENEKHPTELDKDKRNPQGENKEVSKLSSEKERVAKTPSIQSESRKIKLCSILAGKTNISPERFTGTLKKEIPNLMEVSMDESDIVLVFCPIVSRAGTDIEAALKIFTDSTDSKLKVLVVLHHTFDTEKTVPDSSRCVNRTDILTVDCLFYEDTGLLKCQKNDDAIDKVVNWLIQQGEKKGVKVCRWQVETDQSSSFWSRLSGPFKGNKQGSSSDNM